jgi:regulator of protease activity HflC (stomatin/prohibitin superfamily)
VLEKAGETWGIRVHRYEIKNISPPKSVQQSMEKQVTAERNRRAILAKSEGDKQAKINVSEGRKTEMINLSEGEMTKKVNEAEGRAEEILTIAKATAESIEKIAKVVSKESGEKAIRLQLSQKLFGKIQHLADGDTRVILPKNVSDFNGWLKSVNLQ